MSRRLRRSEVTAALRAQIEAEVTSVAGNRWLSRAESPKLDALIRRAEAALRAEGGRGARVRVSALIERANAEVLAAWEAVDGAGPGLDAALLSKDEIRAILGLDAEAGAYLARVAEALRAAPPRERSDALDALVRTLGRLDLSEGDLSAVLPGATRLDARKGRPDRAGLPAAVLDGFDWFYRLEARDIGSARIYRVEAGATSATVLSVGTDGDERWIEVNAQLGDPVASGRWYGGKLLAWDEFFGRGRLDPIPLQSDGYTVEEGYSEPDERVAAGQIPLDWSGELTLDSGQLQPVGSQLGPITVSATLTEAQRELAWAAFGLIWARVLRYRADGAAPVELGHGARGNGELRIGAFTRPTDGVEYQTAWWRDIDDGSYVFYLLRTDGHLRLAIEQFDN